MLFFSDQQVREPADDNLVIRAICTAFARDVSAILRMPARVSLEMVNGSLLPMISAYVAIWRVPAVKLITVSREAGVVASSLIFMGSQTARSFRETTGRDTFVFKSVGCGLEHLITPDVIYRCVTVAK
jgi:ornithine cyclodeaminase/alanine dehydrogenase-like protein (mu-crystallin family)